MFDRQEKLKRTLALNTAADRLGFDETTRRAMTHIETVVAIMSMAGVTWEDVPETFSVERTITKKFGEHGAAILRTIDSGLELVIESERDPELRTRLLERYVQCIELARPGETMTLAQTLQCLMGRGNN